MIEEMRLRGGDKNGSKLAKNRTKSIMRTKSKMKIGLLDNESKIYIKYKMEEEKKQEDSADENKRERRG